jgi:hypothetical protein
VNGTPSHDHLGDIFATLDARAFQLCFVAWVAALTKTPAEGQQRFRSGDGRRAGRLYTATRSRLPAGLSSTSQPIRTPSVH